MQTFAPFFEYSLLTAAELYLQTFRPWLLPLNLLSTGSPFSLDPSVNQLFVIQMGLKVPMAHPGAWVCPKAPTHVVTFVGATDML